MGYADVVTAYEQEHGMYERLAAFAQQELVRAVRAAGVYAQAVTGRAKDPRSFGIKACVGRKYADPHTEIEDKAGVRVVVSYQRDVDIVVAAAMRTFDAGKPERKLDALAYDKNGYLGTHIVAKLTNEQVARGSPELAGRVFEIQIRTMAQGAWAEVSHSQLYKPPADVPDALKRRIYRLVALVELFDSEVEGFLQEAADTVGFREASALATMTEAMAKVGNTRTPDRRLTSEIAAAVVPLYHSTPAQVACLLESFAKTHQAGLQNIIGEAESLDQRDINPLLAQPELAMICERLEMDRINLEQAWPDSVPVEWLDDLAEKWGLGRLPT